MLRHLNIQLKTCFVLQDTLLAKVVTRFEAQAIVLILGALTVRTRLGGIWFVIRPVALSLADLLDSVGARMI